MPESTMATPMPLPVGSVSVSPSSARRSLFLIRPVPVFVSSPSADSGEDVTGASMEIDATPGSVSNHARSLVEMVSAIALARGAMWPTRDAVCAQRTQQRGPIRVAVGADDDADGVVLTSRSLDCWICWSLFAVFGSVAPRRWRTSPEPAVPPTSATSAHVRSLSRLMTASA